MKLKYDAKRLSKTVKDKRGGGKGLRTAAKEIGVSASTLSRVENFKEPDITSMAKICLWVDRPMEYFFKESK